MLAHSGYQRRDTIILEATHILQGEGVREKGKKQVKRISKRNKRPDPGKVK